MLFHIFVKTTNSAHRNACINGIVGNIFVDQTISTDDYIIANARIIQYPCTRTDKNIIHNFYATNFLHKFCPPKFFVEQEMNAIMGNKMAPQTNYDIIMNENKI